MQQAVRPETLIDAIGADAWAGLRAHMQRRSYAPGELLIAQGALEPDFLIIEDGVAGVEASGPQGGRRSLGTLTAGDSVGDMALLTGDPASADVVARTTVVAYAIAPSRIAELEEPRHRLFEALAQLLASRLRSANQRLLAQHAAARHVLRYAPETLPALRRLPAQVARVVDAPVLVVSIGDDVPTFDEDRRISARHVSADDLSELPRLLDRSAHEFDRVLIFEPLSLSGVTIADADSVFDVLPSSVRAAGEASVISVGNDPWTQPRLRALSERAGRKVVGVLPADGGGSGVRDPLARVARTITGRRVGLALGAGAAKGLAHIGVLQAIDELKIDIDVISGCSIGAAIASAYAAGYHAKELQTEVGRVAARALRPTLPVHSFLSNKGIRDELERLGQGRRFEDLDMALAIPAVDLFRRCEVTFTTGLVWPRILASMAIPGIYPPLRAGDTYLVDGSVLTPVPVRQCRELGAGVVVGVRLTGSRTSPRDQLDFDPSRPLAADTITRCFEIMNNRLSELSRDEADVSIDVMLERGGLRDFDRAPEYAEAGREATLASRDALAAVMPYIGAAA